MEEDSDKAFLDSLLADKKLSKVDYDDEILALKDLTGSPVAKQKYKARLAKLNPIVPGEIPSGNNEGEIPTGSDEQVLVGNVRAFCKKNGIEFDENSTISIRNGFKAYYANGGK